MRGERRLGISKLTAMLGSDPPVLNSKVARRAPVNMFEGDRGDLSSILTALDPITADETSCLFLLVPLNLASSRRFALFEGGGDFTRQVEVAQDLGVRKLVSAYFQGLQLRNSQEVHNEAAFWVFLCLILK